MELVLRQWGNSLGLRIPTAEASRLGWEPGSKVVLDDLPTGIQLTSKDDPLSWLDEYPAELYGNSYWGDNVVQGEVW